MKGSPEQAPLNSDDLDEDQTDLVPEDSKEDKWFKLYEKMPYRDLAIKMVELAKLAKSAEDACKEFKSEFDVIRLRVVPQRFSEEGLTGMKVEGVGRLGITRDAYCNVLKDNQESLLQFLRDNGYADLIKDTVNPSSLKALVKEMHQTHLESSAEFSLDDDVEAIAAEAVLDDFQKIIEIVNYTPFIRASVTKG